jgi:hypothetical protein
MTIASRAFRGDRAVSPVSRRTFTKVEPTAAAKVTATTPGVAFRYYEGDWNKLPEFAKMKPLSTGHVTAFDLKPRTSEVHFGFHYEGYIQVPADGAYTFWIGSDDGSNLYVDGRLLVDNDGLHSLAEKSGAAALAAGPHPIAIDYFEKTGGHELQLWWTGPGMTRKEIKASDLVTEKP